MSYQNYKNSRTTGSVETRSVIPPRDHSATVRKFKIYLPTDERCDLRKKKTDTADHFLLDSNDDADHIRQLLSNPGSVKICCKSKKSTTGRQSFISA